MSRRAAAEFRGAGARNRSPESMHTGRTTGPHALRSLVESLSTDERRVYKSLLAGEADKFFNSDHELRVDSREFREFATLLMLLTPHSDEVPRSGVSFVGAPTWLTEELLGMLRGEADSGMFETLDRGDHLLGCGGPIADRLAVSRVVVDFISDLVGPVRATGIASYMFYRQAGSGIRPHVDTEVFSVNLMIKLKHTLRSGCPPSMTVIFPPELPRMSYHIPEGQAMLLHGSAMLHARTIVRDGEDISLLTIGFNKI
jgi:hypothetical protein